MKRDVYTGHLKLNGEEHEITLMVANNYVSALKDLKHFKEAKSLLLRTIPVARRTLGEGHHLTLIMRWTSAEALYSDPGATLDDLREAVTTLEDAERTARRVLGSAHPLTQSIERALQIGRVVLAARETPPGSSKGSN